VAHHASAQKQMRQSVKRRARNRANLSQLKTHVKKLRAVIASGDAEAARKLLPATVGQIDKAAKKGVVHDNAAARYKSRLARKVSALVPPAK
jgi:small subunit ribosomal protein S20